MLARISHEELNQLLREYGWTRILSRAMIGNHASIDGRQIKGTFRAHQVALLIDTEHPEHLGQLEVWMRSYQPDELFDQQGCLLP